MERHLPSPGPLDLDDPYPDLDPGPGPWVALGLATSVDGATAVAGTSRGLGGPGDRAAFRAVRGLADVVVVGRRTAEVERYGRVRPLAGLAGRTRRGQSAHPTIALVSGSGAVPADLPLWDEEGPTPLVLTTTAGAERAAAAVTGRAEVVVVTTAGTTAGTDVVDPSAVVSGLAARGLRRIVCEGGPGLAHAMLGAGVVDELFVTITPQLVGGGVGLAGATLPQVTSLELAELRTHGSELVCRYLLRSAGER